MSWLTQEHSSQKELATAFMRLVEEQSILKVPGAHDGMAALIAKQVGFKALYLSGAAYTASKGLPDLGIVNSEEIALRAKEIIRATNLPLLVDIDTGYGGVLNTVRTAKEMMEVNVAAVQIEDQDSPKKCGHLNGKKLVTTDTMVEKIKAIKEVAPTLIIVARTDALGVEGIESAIERSNEYVQAGADVIFSEALTKKEEFEQFKQNVTIPLLANMTEFGKTPYYNATEFEDFGYSLVIYPVSSLRVAAKAYERVFVELLEKGTQKDFLESMQTREELYETIDYYRYEELDKKIAKTKL
ncbi:methylisocitrate lyase [Virgibacillus necropolis]|uniref:Methylisocitrate lyase n=1 Tax=Virgibacillus necropolis TaxID=163877 RepID=A0A221MAJ6_9BACI|nr:methylisocitrate lyase [Virgibacillus necropolis]ASN04657.1 methylisocitrate lyase [Virgibacillus necropolis]